MLRSLPYLLYLRLPFPQLFNIHRGPDTLSTYHGLRVHTWHVFSLRYVTTARYWNEYALQAQNIGGNNLKHIILASMNPYEIDRIPFCAIFIFSSWPSWLLVKQNHLQQLAQISKPYLLSLLKLHLLRTIPHHSQSLYSQHVEIAHVSVYCK